jgi:hypothetical protein
MASGARDNSASSNSLRRLCAQLASGKSWEGGWM